MYDDSLLVSVKNGIDHVAYASRDTDKTAKMFAIFSFKIVIYKKKINKFNILVSKLKNDKGDVIEIVEPYASPNPVTSLLHKAECVVYHICYKVEDFYEIYNELMECGTVVISKPFESLLFDNYMVSHMYHPFLGLFEIFGKKRC